MNDINTRLKKIEVQEYEDLIEKVKPKPPILKNFVQAFIIGGLICIIAQLILNFYLGSLTRLEAISAMFITMIFLGALLTSIGKYKMISKIGEAGAIIPITGFANLTVASAMDFKKDGYILGLASKMFDLVGPIFVYGFVISVLIGLINFVFIS
ncbi:Stage V sporulation protein AC (SpoVAC) [Candidatus Syntrophocurvum alkaliphilum]|uniref:Stage V sporulation protein AC (SpoVAC) n=1 Tax=Candidatus Syntrophocurvum alkaliphilum TaxID=2293317 RepID=A0A6I6DEN9_9FIRM|nr:SpoVA/SpoVAEb family sporulation membrane protein [Candidatus Syntrophocurvum alkaliphilum]QGT98998.1 Stage V sporulation protein AC (SpoVAC) [Candidatus Syntrophocurvum alkaliphilum]